MNCCLDVVVVGGGERQHFMSQPKETQEHLRNKVTGISMETVTKGLQMIDITTI